MTISRSFLLASGIALAACAAGGCSDGSVAQGTSPPCTGSSCACDNLFVPVSTCLEVALPPAAAGGVRPCVVVEATDDAPCNCDTPGRSPVQFEHMCAVSAAMGSSSMTWSCFCEVDQTTGAAQTSCENDPQPMSSADGWCYVDDTGPVAVGNPELVKDCSASERRTIRFVGAAEPSPSASLFVACGQ